MSLCLHAEHLFSHQHMLSERKSQKKKRRQRKLWGFVSPHIRNKNQKVTTIKNRTRDDEDQTNEASSLPSFLVFSLHLLLSSPPPSGFYSIRSLGFPSSCEGSTVLSRALAAAGVSSHLHLSLAIDLSLSLSHPFPLRDTLFSLFLNETQHSSFMLVHHLPFPLSFSLSVSVSQSLSLSLARLSLKRNTPL